MNLQGRLNRIEKLLPVREWVTLCPRDVPLDVWRAIGLRLVQLPPYAFHPFRDVQDVVAWLASVRPEALQNCPGPVLQASCWVEAEEAGEEFEPIDFHGMSDQELQEIIDQAEA